MFVYGTVAQKKAEPEEVPPEKVSHEAAPPTPVSDPQPEPQPFQPPPPPKGRNPCCCCKLEIGIIWLIVFTIILDLGMIIGNVTVDLQNPFTLAGVVGIASAIVLGVGVKKKSVIVVKVGFGGYIVTLGLILICLGVWFLFLFTVFPPDSLRTSTTTTVRPSNNETKSTKTTRKPKRVDLKDWTFILPITLVFVVAVAYVYMIVVIYFYMKQLRALEGQVHQPSEGTDKVPLKEEEDEESGREPSTTPKEGTRVNN